MRSEEALERKCTALKNDKKVGDDCMNFLLTNDDGIDSPGLAAMVDVMKEYGDVFVVCPDRDNSGMGHSITFREPMTVIETAIFGEGVKAWTVSGTPADCVKIAMEVLVPDVIDFVVSGMNIGSNVGRDSYYSGTIGAAREASYFGVPAVAVSLDIEDAQLTDFGTAKKHLINVMRTILRNQYKSNLLLNINIPHIEESQCKGVRFAELDFGIQRYTYVEESNPSGELVYWLRGRPSQFIFDAPEGDFKLLQEGYITVTPLKIELTDRRSKAEIEKWFKKSLILQ